MAAALNALTRRRAALHQHAVRGSTACLEQPEEMKRKGASHPVHGKGKGASPPVHGKRKGASPPVTTAGRSFHRRACALPLHFFRSLLRSAARFGTRRAYAAPLACPTLNSWRPRKPLL